MIEYNICMTSEVGVRYHGIRRLESPVHDPGGLIAVKAVK